MVGMCNHWEVGDQNMDIMFSRKCLLFLSDISYIIAISFEALMPNNFTMAKFGHQVFNILAKT